jgi:hypothetical protein
VEHKRDYKKQKGKEKSKGEDLEKKDLWAIKPYI